MKKIFYILLILVAVAAGGLYWLVSSGEYKPYLEQQLEQLTGRQVKVAGKINMSFYPWLGLTVNDVSISNTKEFGQGQLATIGHLKLKTELLPLLKGQVKVDKILLESLKLNLVTNKRGQTNWSSSGDKTDAEFDFSQLDKLSFAKVDIVNASVKHTDEKTKAVSKLDKLNLSLGKFSSGKDLPVAVNFTASDSGAKNQVAAKFNLSTNFASGKFVLRKLTASLKNLGLSLIANSDLIIDPKSESISSKGFKLKGDGFAGNMSLKVSKAFSNPIASGSLSGLKVNLRRILVANNVKLQTSSKSALQSLAGKMNFSFAANKLSLSKMVVVLDKTNLAGSLVLNTKSSAVDFNLAADSINLDSYLSPGSNAKNTKILPIADLRTLNIKGKVKFSKNVQYSGINLSKPAISLNISNGVLNIKPISAGVFGGSYAGGGVINVAGKTPSFKFNESLKNINAKQLLEFLIGKNYVGGNVWLEGRANASANVSMYGNTTNSLIGSLAGKMNLSLNKGVVKGIDLLYELTRVHQLANKKLPSKRSGAKQTKINKFVVNSTAKKGVIYSSNILVLTDVFKVTGKGSAALVSEKLDYKLVLEVLNTKAVKNTAVRDLVGYKIPFTLRGSFAEPKVNIDSKAILKVLLNKELDKEKAKLKKRLAAEKAKLEKRLAGEKAELKKRLDEKKAKLRAKAKKKLEDKLKNKLNLDKLKSDKLKNELKDKLKNKLKDRFKGLF